MKLEKKCFERTENRKLKSVKAIVVHWPGGKKIGTGYQVLDIDRLWDWMNSESNNSYHYLVAKDRVINTRPLDLRAIHCGHATYREQAKEFFGERICSNLDSPNNHTIGVCALNDNSNGSYTQKTMDSLIELCAILCVKFGLKAEVDLLRHSDITNEKKVKCPLGFYEDDDNPDDLWDTFKEWVSGEVDDIYKRMNLER